MWGERSPDQTSAGWSVEVEITGAISFLCEISTSGAKGVPLSSVRVVVVSTTFLFGISIPSPRSGALALHVHVAIIAGFL